MADLSGLALKKLDKTNWDEYPVGGTFQPPHDPGVMYGRVKSFDFQASNGFLMPIMDAVIEDPVDGRSVELRDWLFTKPLERGRRKGACRAGDMLLACGSESHPGVEPQEWADALEECTDGTFQFQLDWSCYDSEKGEEVAGTWDEFPQDPNNEEKRLPYIIVKGDDGEDRRLTARQKIRYYISAGRE